EVRTRRRASEVLAGVEPDPIAEVALDSTSITARDGEEPVRLRRVELELHEGRGRVEALEPFVRALAAACGLRPASLSKFEAGLLALGLQPPPSPDLGPMAVTTTSSVGELAFAVLRRQFAAVLAREPGTRLGEDPEQ